MTSVFDGYQPYKGDIPRRVTGSLIAFETGEAVVYGLYNAQERGSLFIGAGVQVYEGMIVGQSPKAGDIAVNVCKKKHLTNTRSSGSDDALRLTPPRRMSLEDALEFIGDDELVEVTPKKHPAAQADFGQCPADESHYEKIKRSRKLYRKKCRKGLHAGFSAPFINRK